MCLAKHRLESKLLQLSHLASSIRQMTSLRRRQPAHQTRREQGLAHVLTDHLASAHANCGVQVLVLKDFDQILQLSICGEPTERQGLRVAGYGEKRQKLLALSQRLSPDLGVA